MARRMPFTDQEILETVRMIELETLDIRTTTLGISLLDSSSFAILDQAAIDMMLLAASHTEVPESLRGRAFSIDLAIDYNPDDAP